MKSRLNIMALLLSILLMTAGCQSAEQRKLQQCVEETAQSCPIKCPNGFVIDTITYDSHNVTYKASVGSSIVDLGELNGQQQRISKALVQAFISAESPKIIDDLKLCAEADANINFVISDGVQELTVVIDPKDYLSQIETK